jgi:N,N'-diacetyllegionaminate synthase
MSSAQVVIAGRSVGAGLPCFVIAEAGVNHNGNVDVAIRLVDAAADVGADAVKFQTFSADRLVTLEAPRAAYQLSRVGEGSQHAMLRALELTEADHRAIQRRCAERRICFLSTPFDEQAADLLERLGVAAFKIPSGELTNLLLIDHIAGKRKPIVLSTGMSDLDEVAIAVGRIHKCGTPLALLQCTSAYPADAASANLLAMRTMAEAFKVPVGLSDHTQGIAVPIAAAALGAAIIEKHLTLDRTMAGPDHQASLEPAEFRAMVDGIHDAQAALGDGIKRPSHGERELARIVRRSLVAARALPAGHLLTAADLVAKRPGTGLPVAEVNAIIGRRLRRAVVRDEILSWAHLDATRDSEP